MTWVKVCGMTSAEECAAAIDAGVDALGFIVDVPIASPRAIPVERARRLCADLPSSVTSVLVTMPSDPSRLVELIRSVPVDAVQLHGTDDPVTVEAMATAIERPIIVAASCDDPDVDRLVHAADALLVDTPGRSGRGGTGRTHDWAATRSLTEEVDAPVIVAGGLTPDNVSTAIRAIRPAGVDVATGVEAAPGVTDPALVCEFVDRVHETGAGGRTPLDLDRATNVHVRSR